MHGEVREYLAPLLPRLRLRVLELGSLDVNGTVRDLLPVTEYLGVDMRPGPGVDVVADAAAPGLLDVVGGGWDLVLCLEVLEHAAQAGEILVNAARCLRTGGQLVATMAGPGREPHGVDGQGVGDEFYRNVTPEMLVGWLATAGFGDIAVALGRGEQDLYCRAVRP